MKGFDFYLNEELDTAKAEQAWAEFEPAIRKAAATYIHTHRVMGGYTVDDLVNEGYEPMLRALRTYDPTSGVPLEAWVVIKCKGYWRNMTRGEDALDHPATISIDSPAHPGVDDNDETIGELIVDEDAKSAEGIVSDMMMCGYLEVIQSIINTMPDDVRVAITKRYIEGYDLKDIQVPSAASKIQTGLRILRKELRSRGMYEGGMHFGCK